MATGTLTRAIMRLMTNHANLVTKHFINLAAKGFQGTVAKATFVGKALRMLFMVKGDSTCGSPIDLGEVKITFDVGKSERH